MTKTEQINHITAVLRDCDPTTVSAISEAIDKIINSTERTMLSKILDFLVNRLM